MESWLDGCTGKPHNVVFGTVESLCSYCGHACRKKCSWAEDFTPVEGWTAYQNKNGYFVVACPQFEKEKLASRIPERLDTDGCINLVEAMIRVMKSDYVDLPKARPGIERFIRNHDNNGLIFFADPEEIIAQLKKDANEADMKRKEKKHGKSGST